MNFKKIIFGLVCLLFVFSLSSKETFAATASTTGQKIEVLSPSGKSGEEFFKRGEKIYYTYTLTKNSKKLEVSLHGGPDDKEVYKVKRYDGWGTNKKVIPAKDTAKLEPGSYMLLICDYTENKDDPVCDGSDGVITITDDEALDVATTTPKDQKIEIKSPNGGEQFYKGESINYSYRLAKNTKNLLVELVDADKNTVRYKAKRYDGWGDNTKTISKNETKKIPAGMYKLRICDTSTRIPVCDTSDDRFTIVSKISTSEILAPVLTKVQAKAAEDNELFAAESAVVYGKNIINEYTRVYIVLKDGQKKFFSARDLNTTSMAISTFESGVLADGTYSLYAVNGDKVSNAITITYKNQTASTTEPSIKVLSPNGGEIFTKGQSINIKWKALNVGSKTLEVDLLKDDGTLVYNIQSSVDPLLGSSKLAPATWHIPTDGGPGGRTIEFGDYKIKVCLTGESGICDISDRSFFIREMNSNTADSDPSDGTYGDRQGDKTRTEEVNTNSGVIKGTPTDACKNIAGAQAHIPEGYTNVGVKVSGNCKKIGAKDENSEPIKDETKNQEQKIEKICQILQTKITNGRVQTKETEWKTVKCDSDAFKNAKPKERQTKTKNVEKGTTSASETSYSSAVELELGTTHEVVKSIQQYLNANGYMVSERDGEPGSEGYESDYFGQKTKQALIKFQEDKGITPAAGYFGPKTRAAMGI